MGVGRYFSWQRVRPTRLSSRMLWGISHIRAFVNPSFAPCFQACAVFLSRQTAGFIIAQTRFLEVPLSRFSMIERISGELEPICLAIAEVYNV